MSMDALTNAALRALIEERLDKLKLDLQSLADTPENQRDHQSFSSLHLQETIDLLSLIKIWNEPDPVKAEVPVEDRQQLSDEEAWALYEQMNTEDPDQSEAFGTNNQEDETIDDPELISDFIANAEELLEEVGSSILELEKGNVSDHIDRLFRAVHSLKGVAGMFGFKTIESLAHACETLFDGIRKGRLLADHEVTDLALSGFDGLNSLVQQISSGIDPEINIEQLITDLNTKVVDAAEAESSVPRKVESNTAVESNFLKVPHNKIDELANAVGEIISDYGRLESIEHHFKIAASRDPNSAQLSEICGQLDQHIQRLQDLVMDVRLVPVGNAFKILPRAVRDVARRNGKQIDIQISGEETTLDKTIVERLKDPLIHIVRNACDHGIEPPEVRVHGNKHPTGMISVNARREGNNVVISISDDGAGLNIDAIRDKAIALGFIDSESAMTTREIVNFIFAPGFSTAGSLTEVSGRGVGMDVVREEIRTLKGTVEVDSAKDAGTTFVVRVPLSLISVRCLHVSIGDNVFSLPVDGIVSSERIKTKKLIDIDGQLIWRMDDHVIPTQYLRDFVDSPGNTKTMSGTVDDFKYLISIGSKDRRYGLIVDSIGRQEEVVIRPLPGVFKRSEIASGTFISGEGRPIVMLDLQKIEEMIRTTHRGLIA